MTYDRRKIMNRAWELVRCADRTRFALGFLLRNALRTAWAEARHDLRMAAARPVSDLSPIERALISLENKDHLSEADYAEIDRLRAAVATERQDLKRALIASAGGRFCTVTFTKVDGSERVMRVQPAKLKLHVLGEAATEAGRKAAATRAQRHPNLMPVWDVEARAIRSVNLATVSRIAAAGIVHTFNG